MELEVKEYQLPAEITFNFEDLKNEITAKAKYYETIVYTEDQIAEAKKDKASLNKLKKALNDERIRLEREYMSPFETFKAKVKELCTLIDKPVAVIDKQITAAEDERKNIKRQEIESFFTVTSHPDWLKLTMIFNEKWLNASYKMQTIKDEISMNLAMIEGNVKTLEGLEFGFEALDVYKRTLDMNQAISEGKRLMELQKAKESAQKAQEEPKSEEPTKISTKEEKAQETPHNDPVKWYSFGAFMTPTQVTKLMSWAKSENIQIVEVLP